MIYLIIMLLMYTLFLDLFSARSVIDKLKKNKVYYFSIKFKYSHDYRDLPFTYLKVHTFKSTLLQNTSTTLLLLRLFLLLQNTLKKLTTPSSFCVPNLSFCSKQIKIHLNFIIHAKRFLLWQKRVKQT